ncbi:MAG TPA: lipoyl(octanoyl) transferase LipB [Edaphocola sp.]|nr:lipoyl(octanoyl) transferase LipB [Edaphocola sp.]
MKNILLRDLGTIEYGKAWELQESLMKKGLDIKAELFHHPEKKPEAEIQNYLLLCRHPHVYTLGKSGVIEHLLINDQRMKDLDVSFYKTNRGGDITYHGPGQLVAYPILDLEQFFTDLGRYMRSLEESIILMLQEYGIEAGRLPGSTGVWLDAGIPGKARKICAMGVRSSRWITIHGLALNINTDLKYFDYIVPCGISDKGVTSMHKELGIPVDEKEVERIFLEKFARVFEAGIRPVTEKMPLMERP